MSSFSLLLIGLFLPFFTPPSAGFQAGAAVCFPGSCVPVRGAGLEEGWPGCSSAMGSSSGSLTASPAAAPLPQPGMSPLPSHSDRALQIPPQEMAEILFIFVLGIKSLEKHSLEGTLCIELNLVPCHLGRQSLWNAAAPRQAAVIPALPGKAVPWFRGAHWPWRDELLITLLAAGLSPPLQFNIPGEFS